MNCKRILVTGGRSGLGLEIVNQLLKAGHNAHSYDIADGLDVRKPEGFLEGLQVEVLINCAGINANEWFEDVTMESMSRIMDVNAFSIVKMTQVLLPSLIEMKGTVINIVSNGAELPMTCSLAYNASKAAAKMITKQMARELTKKYGITVFSVSPNKLVGTGMSKQIESGVAANRGWTQEYADEYQKASLMHGLETPPEAVARQIVHLIESGDMLYLSGCDITFGK